MNGMDSIDLNADLGEGAPGEAELFATGITSVNIACGAHAGDEAAMRAVCRAARLRGVSVGAHPGYADRANFGRCPVLLPADGLRDLLERQVAVLAGVAAAEGVELAHLKPHGALYHFLNHDESAARVCVDVARAFGDGGLALFGPPVGALGAAARAAGVDFVAEGFIDRGYREDGTLIPRGEPGALIHDQKEALAQALRLTRSGGVQTLCVHGDGPAAARLLGAVRAGLALAGFSFSAPGRRWGRGVDVPGSGRGPGRRRP